MIPIKQDATTTTTEHYFAFKTKKYFELISL